MNPVHKSFLLISHASTVKKCNIKLNVTAEKNVL